jgi:hypothetical protein
MTDPLVEAAKAVHRTFGMLEPHPDDCAFCEPILSALRAAQAEAERRYTALKAECDADHPPEPWASELQARVEAAEMETLTWRRMVDSERERTAAAERRAQAAEAIALGGKLCISQQHADLERRAQEAEHGIARWEVYAQGLEAQVRSAREALRMLMSNAMAILRETGGHRGLAHTSRVSMELAIDFARSALSSSPVSSPERKE